MSGKFFPGDDAILFKESLEKLLRQRWGASKRQEVKAGNSCITELWQDMARLGVLNSFHSENCGGAAGGGHFLRIVMEAVGRHRVPGAFVDTIAVAGVTLAGSEKGRQVAARVGAGSDLCILAWAENDRRNCGAAKQVRASIRGPLYVVDGEKVNVPYADRSSYIAVSSLIEDRSQREQALILVPSNTKGVRMDTHPRFDGSTSSTVHFDNVEVDEGCVLHRGEVAEDILKRAIRFAVLAQAAEAVGLMERLLALTLDHVKMRKQFGHAIGNNQAIQHRIVDMYTAYQTSSAYVQSTLALVESPDNDVSDHIVTKVKLHTDRSVRLIAHEAVQLHGGMGVSEEHEVGLYLRRAVSIALTYADEYDLHSYYREAVHAG